MGRQILRKRSKRVISLDPNKFAYTMFARNYVKNLMKSLPKISSNPSHQQQQQQDFHKLVKFEVDMAMADSASEFAWGNALKKKLLIQRQEACNPHLQTVKFSQDHQNLEEEEKEEKNIENGLMKLRKIIPGGNGEYSSNGDLEEDDLLKQTESYIKCLQLQVNVLRCLVHTNTI